MASEHCPCAWAQEIGEILRSETQKPAYAQKIRKKLRADAENPASAPELGKILRSEAKKPAYAQEIRKKLRGSLGSKAAAPERGRGRIGRGTQFDFENAAGSEIGVMEGAVGIGLAIEPDRLDVAVIVSRN